MPRKPRIKTAEFPYHLTARSNNREWFSLPPDDCWRIFTTTLHATSIIYGVKVHALVLMSNHLHMLLSTPLNDISESMQWFFKQISNQVNDYTGNINHVFGRRYWTSVIKSPAHYANVYRYLYQNPLRAQMVMNVLEYRYSSLRGLIGLEKLLLPIVEPDHGIGNFIPEDLVELLQWLNEPYEPELAEIIRKGLSRSEFKVPSRRKSRYKNPLSDIVF